MKKKLPPYANSMGKFKKDEVVICTGSRAWQSANRVTWQVKTPKLVLPPEDDPAAYHWPVSGRYCQIWSCGEPEPQETLFKLTKMLLEFGAIKVLLLDTNRPLIVIEPDLSMEAAA